VDHLKLKKLKSIAYHALRDSLRWKGEYLLDPFGHHTPEEEIIIDLLTGRISPERKGDSVEKYYSKIHEWFLEALLKEDIFKDIIDSAVIKINPLGKECIIVAQGREFRANLKYK